MTIPGSSTRGPDGQTTTTNVDQLFSAVDVDVKMSRA
jgi:hypothetical protein